MQIVLGCVMAERVGHAHHDGAGRRDRTEPVDGDGSALVVADLFEIADHQHRSIGEQRQGDSQQKQVQTLLKQYQQRKLSTKDLDGIDVRALLDRFAQDEVAFYVGPRGN